MSYKSVKTEIANVLREVKYFSRVAVEFLPQQKGESSKIVYMTEPEIRALQVIVARRVERCGLAATKKWLSTFVVYDGPTKRNSKPMEFRPDGCFSTEFQKGFFTVNTDLVFEIL
jgi:hypothetical protein